MTPTPPRDLREYDRDGIAGTIHTPDPAAVARLRALLGHTGQPAPARRNDSGDRICANLQRASVTVNDRRCKALPAEEIASVRTRLAAGETGKAIAREYGMAYTTMMRVLQRDAAEQRRAGKAQQ